MVSSVASLALSKPLVYINNQFLLKIPLIAMEKYAWLNQWTFAGRLDTSGESVEEALVGCLNHLKDAVSTTIKYLLNLKNFHAGGRN